MRLASVRSRCTFLRESLTGAQLSPKEFEEGFCKWEDALAKSHALLLAIASLEKHLKARIDSDESRDTGSIESQL
jgi:hypothetical protein